MSHDLPDPGLSHPEVMGVGEVGVQTCPKCSYPQPAGRTECERCGVIFAKVRGRDSPGAGPLRKPESAADEEITPEGGWAAQLAGLLFEVPAEAMPLLAVGRAIVYVGLLVWGWRFILASIESNTVGESFIHLVNLPFHEAGHILFGFFAPQTEVIVAFRQEHEVGRGHVRAAAEGLVNYVARRSVVRHHISASAGRKQRDEQNTARLLQGAALVPVRDPRLGESLTFENR